MIKEYNFTVKEEVTEGYMSLHYDKESKKVIAEWDTGEYYVNEEPLSDNQVQELIDFAEFLKETKKKK